MIPEPTSVLIADPSDTLRRRLSLKLSERGVFCDSVADGASAISKLAAGTYLVVLLDPELPEAGAAEKILSRISVTPANRRPVVLVLASPRVAKSFDVEAVQVVLRKPCDMAQLAEIVVSCVHALATGREADRAQSKRLTTEERSSA